MRARSIAVVALVSALAACGGEATAPSTLAATPASTATAIATAEPTVRAANDFSGLDVCTLIDEATVQGITGEAVGFTTDGRKSLNASRCFWGAREPGVPAYVEIDVSNSPPDLSGVGFTGCDAASPVTGIGTEAKGGSCIMSSQRKVYLIAIDQGVRVDILVNEPNRPLEPEDLADMMERVLQESS